MAFVTLHKAGSVLANEVFRRLTSENGLRHIDLAGDAFAAGVEEEDHCLAEAHRLKRHGCFFGAFRGPYVRDMLEELSSVRLIVQVRDPRDCIVSLYYSLLHSHAPPGDGPALAAHEARVARFRRMGIEAFALEESRAYAVRLRVLKRLLARHQDAVVLSYEQMIETPHAWLSEVAEFLRMQPSQELVDWLRDETCVEGLDERMDQHRRQVSPGDFRRKLEPGIQRRMTGRLRSGLRTFGYATEPDLPLGRLFGGVLDAAYRRRLARPGAVR